MGNDTFFFSCLALVMSLSLIPVWFYHRQKPGVPTKSASDQGGNEALLDANKEILRLQFELQKVAQERDALSQSTAYFARQLSRQETHETQRS